MRDMVNEVRPKALRERLLKVWANLQAPGDLAEPLAFGQSEAEQAHANDSYETV